MPDTNWNPWKLTTLGMLLVIATALVTGIVVANWNGSDTQKAVTVPSSPSAQGAAPPAAAGPQTAQPRTPPAVASTPPASKAVAAKPTAADVEACNTQAREHAGDKTLEVIKDAAIGGAVGAGVGAAGGAVASGGKGAGKGAGVGGVVGLAAGTLYGLNENKKNDEQYRAAYSSCMHSRGYTG